MRGAVKANLIVFLIVAVAAFCISAAVASFTIHEDNDSYKLLSLEDDSFEPNYVYKVPTITPKNTTNTTNSTNTTNITYTNDTTDDWDNSYDYDNWETTYGRYDYED